MSASKEKLIILGTGGNSLDIAELAEQTGKFQPVGYLADNEIREEIDGLPVLGGLAAARQFVDSKFANGIGSDTSYINKPFIISKTGLPDEAFATIIHPTSEEVMSRTAKVEEGVVIFPFVTLRNHTRIGAHTLILSHSSVGHDSKVKPYGTIATGVRISGGVTAEPTVYLGVQSSIKGGITIGEGALVGMGSVVIRDVEPGTKVAGNPAKVIYKK